MTLKSKAGSVWSVAFSPDDTQILAGAADGAIVLWGADREIEHD
jgi:WD40 repeat protein